jgi:hypothetical protein
MSDTTVAPQGAAPPSAAPSAPANEVPINQNPTSSPNPIGSQAPERIKTARESLQEAFDRASNPPPKGERQAPRPAPKPAEAKAGHNNPPEETEKFDLKKPPSDRNKIAGEPQPRDRGRFAPRAQDGQTGTPNAQNAQNAQNARPAQPTQLPAHAPFAQPPQRLSEHARRDWATAPESVRGEIWRQQQEFAKAYTFYKDDHEAYKPIKHYAKMATDAGTDLKTALDNYVGIEKKLREDPIGGLDQIVYNLNLTDPQTGKRIDLRDVSYSVLSQTPEQLQATQTNNAQQATQHQMGAVLQKLERLENEHRQMQYNAQHAYTRSAIDQFALSHPRLDELGKVVEQELKFGFDLETAYRRAEALYPAAHPTNKPQHFRCARRGSLKRSVEETAKAQRIGTRSNAQRHAAVERLALTI